MGAMKHFVLVHGVCLGGWCWFKLAAQLKLSGHRVTALDLGASGINPKQLNELGSVSDYVLPLMDFMASLPQDEKVVLVGHSFGGLSISLAMEKFPEKISVATFVTALLPDLKSSPGALLQEYFKWHPLETFMDCKFTFGEGPQKPLISAIFGPEYMNKKMFLHCSIEELELAKMLIRPTGFFLEDFTNKVHLTKERFESVRRAFIVCEEDEVVEEEFQRLMVKKAGPNEVKVIKEAGHMVMLSKPDELRYCIEEIADKYQSCQSQSQK